MTWGKRRQREAPQSGHWPSPIRQFIWDMLPARYAPPNAGLVEPRYTSPEWISGPIDDRDVLELARLAHERAADRASAAEDKASRLANLSLALLAVSFSLAGYQLSLIRPHGIELQLLFLLPVIMAGLFFALSGIDALEVDRPGMYHQPGADELAGSAEPLKKQIELEDRGRALASWTARNKLSMLLQARAWFSRGLVALTLSGVIAVLMASGIL